MLLSGDANLLIITMDEAAARAAVILLWKEMLTKATEFDLWGQPVEATDTYNR